jgi:hypothetical protein
MYGYEPSWLDIYMNAMANQPPMMPLSSMNQPMPPIDVNTIQPDMTQPMPPIDVNTIQPDMTQPMPPEQNIMVGNEQNQTAPVDDSMSNLSDLSSNGVM